MIDKSSLQELNEMDDLVLHCTAEGNPTPQITWLWKDTLFVLNNTDTVTVSKTVQSFYQVSSTLRRTSLVPDDSGEYKCRLDSTTEGEVVTDVVDISVKGKKKLVSFSFILKSSSTAKNECLIESSVGFTSPCVNGTCTDLLQDYLCECVGNFTGRNCSIPLGKET